MLILGIETSCDESAAAVVSQARDVRASVVASQLKLHAPYGGVVPELASRQHLKDLPMVVEAALQQAGITWQEIAGIAVTYGPGLMGALLVGLTWAKAAAWSRGLPFIGVNHLEGHLHACELNQAELPYPFLGLVASGGHTSLFRVEAGPLPTYHLMARTRDDAVGEAFDKVAKLLGLPYPGGPAIEQAARSQSQPVFQFTSPRMKDGSDDFSYSGIKTAVRYWVENKQKRQEPINLSEIAAAFQQTIAKDLLHKTMETIRKHPVKALVLTGGVAANLYLREAFQQAAQAQQLPFYCPPVKWCTDNAAMIARVGARYLALGKTSSWDLAALPALELGSLDSGLNPVHV